MKNIPLVSVAIITYNQINFLIEAIESVLEQDYPNIEIVIADDCSIDGTQKVLADYKNRFPDKFRIILSDINEGITKNSNKAYFACSGKYISWLGGDDIMYKYKIHKQVEYLEKHTECSIAYHNLEVFDSDTGKIIQCFNNRKNKYNGGVERSIKYGTFNGASSTMVRSDKTPKQGFDEDLNVASDWLFWIETLLPNGKICYIDEILGKYRRHENNITNKNSDLKLNALKDNLKTCEKILAYDKKYEKIINYRLSNVYIEMRKYGYFKNLIKSITYNIFNFKAIILIIIYLGTLGLIKK